MIIQVGHLWSYFYTCLMCLERRSSSQALRHVVDFFNKNESLRYPKKSFKAYVSRIESRVYSMVYEISPSDFAHHVRHATSWNDLGVRCGLEKDDRGYVRNRDKMSILHQKVTNMRLNTDHFHSQQTLIPDDVFIQFVKDSTCLMQVAQKCKSITGKYNSNSKYYNSRIKDLCINTDHFKMRKKWTGGQPSRKMNAIDDETFKTIVQNSRHLLDLFLKCGYTGSMNPVLKNILFNRINRLGLNTEHFERKTIENDKKIVAESRYNHNHKTKQKLLLDFDRRYECNACKNIHFVEQDGVLTWMNKPVELQLDHINGKNDDNRIENLRFLCALCHAQTITFGGANNKKHKAMHAWLEDGKTSHAPGSIAALLN